MSSEESNQKLTGQQQRILKLLFKFRFVSAGLLAMVMGIRREGVYHVRVKERAVEGRANARVIELLAKHFSVQKRAVQIVHGKTSKWKFVEISNVAA